MMIVAMSKISSSYVISGYVLKERMSDARVVEAKLALDLCTSPNMMPLAVYFHHPSIPRDVSMPVPCSPIVSAFRSWDIRVVKQFLRRTISPEFFHQHIWKESTICGLPGIKWTQQERPGGVPPLWILALRAASTYNTAFTGGPDGQYMNYTMSGIYPTKVMLTMAKLSKNTRNLSEFGKTITHLFPEALDLTLDLLETKQHIGKFLFDPDKHRDDSIPMASSSGGRSSQTTYIPPTRS